MKFGRNLHRHQVPEWASFYLNYDGLKRTLKTHPQSIDKPGADPDCNELFAIINRAIDAVNTFYRKKHAVLQQKATILYDYYGLSPDFSSTVHLEAVDPHELQDLLGAFLELRNGMENLQWYGQVNRDGFQNILLKLEELQSGSSHRPGEGKSHLSKSEFADQSQLLKDTKRINKSIAALGDAHSQPPSKSLRISLFLKNFCGRFYPSFTSWDTACQAIRRDDPSALVEILKEQISEDQGSRFGVEALNLAMLECSVSCGSKNCVQKLLPHAGSLQSDEPIDDSNFLHRSIMKMGWRRTLQAWDGQTSNPQGPGKSAKSNAISSLLTGILDQLLPNQRGALHATDSFGRLPLHYTAQYGLVDVCQEILKLTRYWEQDRGSGAAGSLLLQDSEGYTPLHLGVIGGHTAVVGTLLDFLKLNGGSDQMNDAHSFEMLLGNLLHIALQSGFVEIVQLLVATGANVNHPGKYGETALYVAARTGRADCMKILLQAKPVIDAKEMVHGWTPLFIACVEGHLSIVEILLEMGANQENFDFAGWTAIEHAAYRGNRKVAEKLKVSGAGIPAFVPGEVRSHRPASILGPQSTSSDLSQIIVNLGSLDLKKDIKAVDLSPCLSRNAYGQQTETGLLVEVSAIDGTESSRTVQLPFLEDMTNKPWIFSAQDSTEVKLMFTISRRIISETESEDVTLGSGIALLESLKQGLGSERESLSRDHTIPLLGKSTLDFIGTITFSLLIVSPFQHPAGARTEKQAVSQHVGVTKVAGHRGLGQNIAAHTHLQIGENTLQSFLTAVDLGASYVEFDVQLTKELVPVIYHDFLVSETGTDAPMHTLRLDQFMEISNAQSPYGEQSSTANTKKSESSEVQGQRAQRPRSRSLNEYQHYKTDALFERMKHSFDFEMRGFKGNTRHAYIHEPFTTFAGLLEKLPESVGFDIEVKYPMLFETDDWKMDSYHIEVNTFVDVILDKIFKLGGNRTIIFSSFSPEMCILLSIKQQTYPVLFLTDAGQIPVGDVRACSLQEAIHFARRWNLAGIVTASEPIVMCPRLVKYVKSFGLVTSSYGSQNNDPKHAKTQAEAGLDVIIVDSVHLISKTLNG